MADLWIIVGAANASRVSTWLSWFDSVRGFPCCACSVAQDPACTCALHVYPDGSPAPHVGSRTLRHTVSITHPTDGRLAIRVDPWITALRAHPEWLLARGVSQTNVNIFIAAYDAATPLDSTWFPTAGA